MIFRFKNELEIKFLKLYLLLGHNKLLKIYFLLLFFFIFYPIEIKYDTKAINKSLLKEKVNVLFLNKTKNDINELQRKLLKNISNNIPISINYNIKENNSNILIPYIKKQNDFCDNQKKYYNKIIEEQIILRKINFKGYSYKIYIYKNKNFISTELNRIGSFEGIETINILKALQYYGIKKNIKNNKEIFMLDIGGNIGWYPSFLGRFGYSILSFEPLEINYYILRKNYCLINKKNNIVIITKGLNNEEKTCDYYIHVNNPGNGMIICDKKKINDINLNIKFQKLKEVSLTRLSNFIPYLSDKNLALIKIDIEGAEGKAFESGIELITKYHIPFIVIEITPIFLKEHGTDPYEFIKLFVDNGYYISLQGFLNKNYVSIKQLFKKIKFQRNCYFIYKEIID